MQARVREHQRRWGRPSYALNGLRKCRRGAFKFEREPPFEFFDKDNLIQRKAGRNFKKYVLVYSFLLFS